MKKTKQRKSTALAMVQRYFPNVKKIKDATGPIRITVTKADEEHSKRRDHEDCAMAIACKRQFKATGALIARRIAYVVTGEEAIRFSVPASVSREIVSFDRGSGFEPGEYILSKPANRLGQEGGNKGRTGTGLKAFRHVTTNIRTNLRSAVAAA